MPKHISEVGKTRKVLAMATEQQRKIVEAIGKACERIQVQAEHKGEYSKEHVQMLCLSAKTLELIREKSRERHPKSSAIAKRKMRDPIQDEAIRSEVEAIASKTAHLPSEVQDPEELFDDEIHPANGDHGFETDGLI